MKTRDIVIIAVVGITVLFALVLLTRRKPEPQRGVLESWLGLPAGLL